MLDAGPNYAHSGPMCWAKYARHIIFCARIVFSMVILVSIEPPSTRFLKTSLSWILYILYIRNRNLRYLFLVNGFHACTNGSKNPTIYIYSYSTTHSINNAFNQQRMQSTRAGYRPIHPILSIGARDFGGF